MFCSSLKPENLFIENNEDNKLKCIFSGLCKIKDFNTLEDNFNENYETLKSKYCIFSEIYIILGHSGIAKYTAPELFGLFNNN